MHSKGTNAVSHFLTDQIHQLDLALDQLAVNDRNYDRFALMLVDNVIELVLHRHAVDQSIRGRLAKDRGAFPKNHASQVAAALGPRFDAKVKLALATGFIEQHEADALLHLHAIRNTAYHRGERHEGILRSVTLFYVRCVCDVLIKYAPPFWALLGKSVPHRAAKYLGKLDLFVPAAPFVTAWNRLKEVALNLGDDVVIDLHADMVSSIDRVDRDLAFLEANAPNAITRDRAVLEAQLWPVAFSDEGIAFAKKNNGPTPEIPGYVWWFEHNYPWTVTTDPITSWRRRAASLKAEKSPHAALKKYYEFMRQTEVVREAIREFAGSLDAELEARAEARREGF